MKSYNWRRSENVSKRKVCKVYLEIEPIVVFLFDYTCEAVTVQKFELHCGAIFFKDLVVHFHYFGSQIGVMNLVTPRQEVERRSK